jgi:PAT family acetyl-CoA transporter-like MFS transporter 1
MQFFGVVFIVTTTLILIFKHEKCSESKEIIENKLDFRETYRVVWKILNISCVKKLAIIIFTSKV